jgi:hypothetical protein
VNFPEEGLREHHESKASVGKKGLGPGIVRSVKTGSDLVDVISSTHSPLHVIIAEDVVGVLESGGVAVGLLSLIVGSVKGTP